MSTANAWSVFAGSAGEQLGRDWIDTTLILNMKMKITALYPSDSVYLILIWFALASNAEENDCPESSDIRCLIDHTSVL